MFVDFICTNEKCEKFEENEERNIPHGEINAQTCKECGCDLKRIWNSNVSIKTADGFKR